MTISQIKNLVNQLNIIYGYPTEYTSLRDKCISAYYQIVLQKLNLIIYADQTEQLTVTALQQFLTKNWQLINGSLLSYTALPDSEITHLLCDIAKYIVDKINEQLPEGSRSLGIVKALMPTVNTDSLKPAQYLHLGPWYDGKQWHAVAVDIKTILKTHILGREGLYLLPGQLLNELDVALAPKLANPYYDALNVYHREEHWYVDDCEYKRLTNMSPLTSNVADAKNQYDVLANDQSNLLGQLRELLRQLYFNSVHGIGKEKSAGSCAYTAIPKFMEYYAQLDDKSKAKVPNGVKQEIEKLIIHASDKEKIGSIDSCLATRCVTLNESIYTHEPSLSSISLSQANKQLLITEAKKRFTLVKETLQKEIIHRDSCDQLSFNQRLLAKLNIQFKITSFDDLKIIHELSAAEITSLLQNDSIQRRIIRLLSKIDNLIVFSVATSPHRLTIILTTIGLQLSTKLKANDLAAWLINLDLERIEIILHTIKARLPIILQRNADVDTVIRFLTPQQRRLIAIHCKDLLLPLINCSYNFARIIKFFDLEQRAIFYEACKDKLCDYIRYMNDFRYTIEFLGAAQQLSFCMTLQHQLWNIITSQEDNFANQFANMMQLLHRESRSLVYTTCKKQLVDHIWSIKQFAYILQYLNIDQCNDLLRACQLSLPKMLQSECDFHHIASYLTQKQYSAFLLAIFHKKFTDSISALDLYTAILLLAPEPRSLFYLNFKKQAGPKVLSLLLTQLVHASEWDAVQLLCATEYGYQPDQQTATMILIKAISAGQYDVIQQICAIKGDNQPSQQLINTTLHYILMQKEFVIATFICSIKGNNRPTLEQINSTLYHAVNTQQLDIIKFILSIDTIPPDAKTIQEIFDNAILSAQTKFHDEIIQMICAMQGANKLDQKSVNKALAFAVTNKQENRINIFAAMTGSNKPSDIDIQRAQYTINFAKYKISTQIQDIKDLIHTLNNEINSCCWRPNKDLKRQKMGALEELLMKIDSGIAINQAAAEIKAKYPAILFGRNSRVANLINGDLTIMSSTKDSLRHNMFFKQFNHKIHHMPPKVHDIAF